MDRKTLLILAVCLVFWLLLNQAINRFFPPIPVAPGGTNAPAAQTITTTNAAATPSGTAPTPAAPAHFIANTNLAEELLVATNQQAVYTFTSHGGGLKRVELIDYRATVTRKKEPQTNHVTLNEQAKAPVLAILDGESVQGDGIFNLSRTATGVRAEKQLSNGLSIVKEFALSTNYLVIATVRLENQSAQALNLPQQEWVVGTATPMNAQDNGMTVGMMWYNGQKTADMLGASHFSDRGFACTPRTPPADYRGNGNVLWAAAYNQFFTLVVMAQEPAAEVVVRAMTLPRPSGEEARLVATNAPPPKGFETTLVYPAVTLTAQQSVQRQFVIFAGPKEYRTLARIAAQFNNNLDSVMGFGFFGFFAKALLLAMNWLHVAINLPYGWTIVAITVIIKLIFWPLTAASTRSMKKMQALAPQIKAIQEKYKDDPMKVQRKTMELWKENKVNPMGGCLPMLIQMPVFIGFFTMISRAIELRGASFLWIADLSKPDTLFLIPGLGFIPFIGIAGVGLPFNLLPLIMGATMLWQSHLAPMSPGVDPTQQKIMRYMPLIFLLFLYNYSAGMALYWTVNNLLTIVQTKVTKMQDDASAKDPTPKAPVLTAPPKKKK
jgi:YidC/Oxa1 family membrane protein insertase